jgi:hypothetical protein
MSGHSWRAGARWLALGLALVAGAAQARVMAGVRFPDFIELQGQELALEHVARRRVLFFDIYVWGLYLGESPRTAEEAIALNQPKQLQLHFRRSLERDQLVKAFRQFLSQNETLHSPEMREHSEELLGSLRAVHKGDTLLITYLPGKGLLISGDASRGALIPGKAFADALFATWLMENPIYD